MRKFILIMICWLLFPLFSYCQTFNTIISDLGFQTGTFRIPEVNSEYQAFSYSNNDNSNPRYRNIFLDEKTNPSVPEIKNHLYAAIDVQSPFLGLYPFEWGLREVYLLIEFLNKSGSFGLYSPVRMQYYSNRDYQRVFTRSIGFGLKFNMPAFNNHIVFSNGIHIAKYTTQNYSYIHLPAICNYISYRLTNNIEACLSLNYPILILTESDTGYKIDLIDFITYTFGQMSFGVLLKIKVF